MTETLIDLIRHGEPEGGRAYRGNRIDDPLSEKGWQQMWQAIGDHAPWQHIVTSPLQRCQAFAHAVADSFNIPVTVEPRIREVGFGEWEGHTPDEIIASRRLEYEAFYRDPVNKRPAGAEPLADFIERTVNAYEDAVKEYSGQHILIVAHAGVIRSIIAHVLLAAEAGLYRIKVNNAGISRIRHRETGAILEYHNTCMSEIQK